MKNPFLPISALVVSIAGFVVAQTSLAETPKNKVIDASHTLDPKSTKIENLKARIVSTPDPAHKKVLELSADFSVPGVWYTFRKYFLPGTIDPNKYKAVRFFYKSETESMLGVDLRTGVTGPDGRYPIFGTAITGSPEWREAVIPLEEFKTWERKVWKNGEQKVFPAGQPIAQAEYPLLKEMWFNFDVNRRGNSSTAVVLIDGLELVPK